MSKEEQWLYMKYCYDVHHHYGPENPPPPLQEMWDDGVLHLGTAAA